MTASITWQQFGDRWKTYARRTGRADLPTLRQVAESLYVISALKKPFVATVSSPGALAVAGAFATLIFKVRQTNKDYNPAADVSLSSDIPDTSRVIAEAALTAVQAITQPVGGQTMSGDGSVGMALLEATYSPADLATVDALTQEDWSDVRDTVLNIDELLDADQCIRDAMRDQFGNDAMTDVIAAAADDWARTLARDIFGNSQDAEAAVQGIASWWKCSQPGNTGLYWTGCIAAARDVLGLRLPEHENFAHWERFQTNSGCSYLHPEFCLVSDFPKIIIRDNIPMRSAPRKTWARIQQEPSHIWSDGWIV